MRENGTDRDVAIQLLDAVTTAANLVATINNNLYAPRIITQPVDFVGAIGETAVFHVEANHVKAYQWQVQSSGYDYQDSNADGNKTDSLSIKINEARYGYNYRCKITGLDGSIIYTDIVNIIAPKS